MAVRGGSRTLPPPMPAEIHRAPCVTFLEFEIKMGQGHRCRCGGRGAPLRQCRTLSVVTTGPPASTSEAGYPPTRSNFWSRCPTLTSVVYRLPRESMARLCSR